MSDKGTFSTVISHLGNRMNSRGEGSEREELRQSIRVLEAAGKADKDRALRVLATLLKIYVTREFAIRWPDLEQDLQDGAMREIRALLEALPVKEEK